MHLTEFGKAIGEGQGQEAGPTFLKECVWAEADFASHCRIEVGASTGLSGVYIGPLTRHP
jgi:hypothetical protein